LIKTNNSIESYFKNYKTEIEKAKPSIEEFLQVIIQEDIYLEKKWLNSFYKEKKEEKKRGFESYL